MVNHSYIIVSTVYLYCHVKNRCAMMHFTCMVLYMCMCFFLVFIMVLYMCILSFVCLYYAFMYVTLLVGRNKEYLLTYLHNKTTCFYYTFIMGLRCRCHKIQIRYKYISQYIQSRKTLQRERLG